MDKTDLRKSLKHLYTASQKAPAIVDVPALNFLMVDGQGDPNTSLEFHQAVEALYSMSYTLKFSIKKSDPKKDYKVMGLEGLWWMDGVIDMHKKELWKWTVIIAQPDVVTPKWVKTAADDLAKKKNPPALGKVRLERFSEGQCAQILHVGPYSAEGPTIAKLHEYVQAQGYRLRGKHHEIYMSDARRVAPEKLKTILRHPIEKA
ncbi:MAG: GyrI-like domain-containing protein [Candidatus Hydrogenedentes bacterium]|nr:GyrI-like domain-containing protein [Candidatus Hydrogenedentota bacterium]